MTFLTFYSATVIVYMILLVVGIIKDKGITVGDFTYIFVLGVIPVLNVIMAFVLVWALVPNNIWHKTIFNRK